MIQLVLALVLTACAASGDEPARRSVPRDYYSSGIAVCSLLDPADLEGILGHLYKDGVGELNPDFLGIPGTSACAYEAEEGDRAPKIYSGVVYAYAGEVFQNHLDLLRASSRAVTVHGVGERAVWDPAAFQLFVLARDKVLAVHTFPDVEPKSDTLVRARRLALRALGRLR